MQATESTFTPEVVMTEMAEFAARFSLTPREAVFLPSAFGKVAEIAGKHVRSIVSQATYSHPELGEYIAETVRKVAAENPDLV